MALWLVVEVVKMVRIMVGIEVMVMVVEFMLLVLMVMMMMEIIAATIFSHAPRLRPPSIRTAS